MISGCISFIFATLCFTFGWGIVILFRSKEYLVIVKFKIAFCYFKAQWYQLIPKLENSKFFPSLLLFSNPISVSSVNFYS